MLLLRRLLSWLAKPLLIAANWFVRLDADPRPLSYELLGMRLETYGWLNVFVWRPRFYSRRICLIEGYPCFRWFVCWGPFQFGRAS